jgi:hypothetical protein
MGTPVSDHLTNRLRRTLWIPLCFLAGIVCIFLFLSFHDKYFGVAKYESAAVSSLRKIHELESLHATAHLDKGFACQLKQLQSVEEKPTIYGNRMNLLTGEWFGYKFEIVGCTEDKNGVFSRYQVTAVPTKTGVTGVRAFCTDESGDLFYDLNGSATQCLAARQLLARTPNPEGPGDSPESIAKAMFPNAPDNKQDINCFRLLTGEVSVNDVVKKCGRPDQELGSGLYIFVWHMPDGSYVSIGTPYLERIGPVRLTDASGKATILPRKK